MVTLPLIPSLYYDFENVALSSSIMLPVIKEIPSVGYSKGVLQVAYNDGSFTASSEKITLSLVPLEKMADGSMAIGSPVASIDIDSDGEGVLRSAAPFDLPPVMMMLITGTMGSSVGSDCKAVIKATLILTE